MQNQNPKPNKPKSKKKKTDVIGVKLITGIDFIGIKRDPFKTRNNYEKCTQLMVMSMQNGMQVRFVPLNLFDSDLNELPYRDLAIPKNFVLYEYTPDNKIISAYINMITVGEDQEGNAVRH